MISRYAIGNPIINASFAAPARHFRFTETGINNKIVAGQWHSTCFISSQVDVAL